MKSEPTRSQAGHPVYAATRARLFALQAKDIGLAELPNGRDVWGVVVDYPTTLSTGTLVIIADGTVNFLLSDGPAFVGVGQHQEVAGSAAALLSRAQLLRSSLKPTSNFSLATIRGPRIYLLTSDGVLGGESSEVEPRGETKRLLAEICRQGDAVVTTIRVRCEPRGSVPQRFTRKDNVSQLKIIIGSTALGVLLGAVAAPERLPGILMGGVIGLIVGFLGSGVVLLVKDAVRRRQQRKNAPGRTDN